MPVYTFSLTNPFASAGLALTITRLARGWNNSMSIKQGDIAHDVLRGVQTDITTTGTAHDHNPGNQVSVIWNGASALEITGIVPYGDGQIIVYENITSAQYLYFRHQNTGSAASNRLILGSANGQYVGAGGSIGFRYDGTADRWRVLFLNPGKPIVVAFSAGDYTAASGSWTVDSGDVLDASFTQRGNLVDMNLFIAASDVSAAAANLTRVILGGFTAAKAYRLPTWVSNAGGAGATGVCFITSATTAMNFYATAATGAWTITSSDNTQVAMTGSIEVQ